MLRSSRLEAVSQARADWRECTRQLSLDGSIDGVRLVDARLLPSMRTARAASDCDVLLRLPTTFTLGFAKSWGDRRLGPGNHVIIGEHAFGAPGMGGSVAFADGEAAMSFSYAMNRHGGGRRIE